MTDIEFKRLEDDHRRRANWSRFGSYLSERQWGTVREDYSQDNSCWDYFPHDHARSRVYRWGEDGLMGFTDRQCRLCFSFAFWNGNDPYLKERLFGLTGPQGNNGEDVKELYYYLVATPTASYQKALYKYPQTAFPYEQLLRENQNRNQGDPEYEILDTGVFDDDKYFDIFIEYFKNDAEDILIEATIHNRGAEDAPIYVLPNLWFRNTWSWGRTGEGYLDSPPILKRLSDNSLGADHPTLGKFYFYAETSQDLLFTDNETNYQKLFNVKSDNTHFKDGFHDYVVSGKRDAVRFDSGTKAAFLTKHTIPAGGLVKVRLRIINKEVQEPFKNFDLIKEERIKECERFYRSRITAQTEEEYQVSLQSYAGLIWSKQFYFYSVKDWLEGDPGHPVPSGRRNHEWRHLYNRDILSMPDKWEYPWFAAWDTAFHMVALAKVDSFFAKKQLILFLREWYLHPNGQLPAYEFSFSDVNPPVHAWACWQLYQQDKDRVFLSRCFHKLLLNFTWWVNQKDLEGNNLFSGGFLGLDNIGVFDRSAPLPVGGFLEQADATAWMAFYCGTMLSMALELSRQDPSYGDMASKFFEHFVNIISAINSFGGTGLWDQLDGFYYDQLNISGHKTPLRVRSLVGLLPMIAVEILDNDLLNKVPGFKRRMDWFLDHETDLGSHVVFHDDKYLLSIPSRERLERMLQYLVSENEFLSPHGIRSLSKIHDRYPYIFQHGEKKYIVEYNPAESKSGMFGGNSNWRGPVWFPTNFLIIEALRKYHYFYGDNFKVTYQGADLTLLEISKLIAKNLTSIFTVGENGRPCHGGDKRYHDDEHFKDLLLFYEFFNPETGRGLGASHQTGWTALVANCFGLC